MWCRMQINKKKTSGTKHNITTDSVSLCINGISFPNRNGKKSDKIVKSGCGGARGRKRKIIIDEEDINEEKSRR